MANSKFTLIIQVVLVSTLCWACGGISGDSTTHSETCGPHLASGEQTTCDCADGSTRARECLPSGWLSECSCPELANDQTPSGDNGEAGADGSDGSDRSSTGDSADDDQSDSQTSGNSSSDDSGDSADSADSSSGTSTPGQDPEQPQDPFGDIFGDLPSMPGGQFPGGMQMPRLGTGDGEQGEACSGDDGCRAGLLCYVAGGFCTRECEQTSDCAEVGSEYTCGQSSVCRVTCVEQNDCPDDLVCNELPIGSFCGVEGFSFGGF